MTKHIKNYLLGILLLSATSSLAFAEVVVTNNIIGYRPIGGPLMISEVNECRDMCKKNEGCIRYLVKKADDGQINCILTKIEPDYILELDGDGYIYYDLE